MNLMQEILQKPHFLNSNKFIYFYQNYQLSQKMTYPEFKQMIEVKSKIIAEQGISGFCILCIEDPLQFIIQFCSLVLAGCVPVPLATATYSSSKDYQSRIQKMMSDYQFDFAVIDSQSEVYFKQESLPIMNSENIIKNFERRTPSIHTKACFIQFSSGSTSEPKGIVLNHQQLKENINQICETLKPSIDTQILTWLPLYHDMGLIGGILSALHYGSDIHFMSPLDFVGSIRQFLNLVESHKINFLLGPDFMYRQMAREIDKAEYDLSSLEHCLCGAELVLPSTLRSIESSLEHAKVKKSVFRPVYGMAEACLALSFSQPKGSALIHQYSQNQEVVSCGRALAGQEIIVVDQNGDEVSEETVGELAVKGRSLFTEYFFNKYLVPQTKQGYFLTGDEGFTFQGEIYPLGRKRDVVIHNSIKYHSVDLESTIFEATKLGRVACVQLDAFYVVAEIPWQKFYKIPFFKKKIAQSLSQKIPISAKQIFIVPKFDLPRTTSGKIQRYRVQEKIKNKEYAHPFYFTKALLSLLKEYKNRQ